ncbi:MAG: 50S ribosomal protein L18 [Patescibacteria group bacterium]|nr:50S ribosomal protein L18 [Patescibacteria group bacterium]
MNKAKAKQAKSIRRVKRVRSVIKGTAERPRLCVKRSLKHIYVQVIDDAKGKTLAYVSDRDIKDAKLARLEKASALGQAIAEKAKAKGVAKVVFDRRDKRYHGLIKAVAEAARQGGLEF